MWGLHLKKRGDWWHYYRAIPVKFRDIEEKSLISFTLSTRDFSEAKLKAAKISIDLEDEWQKAKERGVSLSSQNLAKQYQASAEIQKNNGFDPKPAASFSDDELLARLRTLLLSGQSNQEQKAVLGLIDQPALSLGDAFDRFWKYIKDEWMRLSHDQRRTKKNIYLKAIRNFEAVIGQLHLYDIERRHALEFRSWWLERVNKEGLKPYTGNREMNSLRRLLTVNYDIDSVSQINPFARVRLKQEIEVARIPLTTDQIRAILAPGAMGNIHNDFLILLRMLVNTGMRPVEAIGLELADIKLDDEIPHVHVRKNSTRVLKTDHSERLLPLNGVSLIATQELVRQGGWGKRAGKNMYATTILNRHLRENELVTGKRQTLYSLRHWFQDQLTKLDVVDRAQAQLMGHKFHRPKYGYGKDLSELQEIIARFAL